MSTLRNFILREDAKVDLASRYLSYLDRYDAEVSNELQATLTREWTDTIAKLNREYPLDAQLASDARLTNDRATLRCTLSAEKVKLRSPRPGEASLVAPSTKVPARYNDSQRKYAQRALLDDAVEAFKHVTKSWSEIFTVEIRGRTQPGFKIINEDHEVKLQLVVELGSQSSYRTLYAVRVELGTPTSKTRDYDLIYFTAVSR